MINDDAYEVPVPIVNAIKGGMPAIKAFRQHDVRSASEIAVEAGITDERMAILEQGTDNATNAELDALSEVLDVPRDLLINE